MQVLVIFAESEKQFLIKLEDNAHIEEVKGLVIAKKRKQAMISALSKGRLIRELTEDEYHYIEADLILTQNGAHWNLI